MVKWLASFTLTSEGVLTVMGPDITVVEDEQSIKVHRVNIANKIPYKGFTVFYKLNAF